MQAAILHGQPLFSNPARFVLPEAKNDVFFVCVMQAAAAWVAAIVAMRPACVSSLLVFSLAGIGFLDFSAGVFIVSRSVERTKKYQFAE